MQSTAQRAATTGVWIVIPAYNEAQRLPRVLRELQANDEYNIVVVDDGSSDETASVAASADTWVLRHIVNRGQGAALQTGISFAIREGASIIVTFDADGQHAPTDIANLIQPIVNKECDVVLGSRFLGTTDGVPVSRKWLLKLATLFTRMSTKLPVTDTHNGLRAISAIAAQQLVITEDGMAHASEILHKLAESNLRWQEAPVHIKYTPETLVKGQSNRAAFQIVFRTFVARLVG